MTHERLEELLIEISKQIATINTNLTNSLTRIEEHEHRISDLENSRLACNKNRLDIKTKLLDYLMRILFISSITIASLVGAAPIISKILGI